MIERPSFEQIMMEFAAALSRRSTCRRRSVGCVITSPDYRRVYAVGYNGNARGGPNDCDVVGDDAQGRCGCVHAEANAAVNCDVPRQFDKVVLVTCLPCVACAKLLINMGGVERVYFRDDYRDPAARTWLQRAGIRVEQLSADGLLRVTAQEPTASPPVRTGVAVMVRQRGQFRPEQTFYMVVEHGKRGGKVSFPGGEVEPGESRRSAAARELREETGIEVDDKYLSVAYEAGHEYGGQAWQVVVYEPVGYDAGTFDDPRPELGDKVAWMTREEIMARALYPDYYARMFEALGEP